MGEGPVRGGARSRSLEGHSISTGSSSTSADAFPRALVVNDTIDSYTHQEMKRLLVMINNSKQGTLVMFDRCIPLALARVGNDRIESYTQREIKSSLVMNQNSRQNRSPLQIVAWTGAANKGRRWLQRNT